MFANLGRVGARSAVDPLPSKVKRILQKYGSYAHLYLPGVGVINGFTAGNYFDSAGTTLASVDGSAGLVLDAAGSVGAELLPFGTVGAAVGAPGNLPTGWQGGITTNGITRQVVNVGVDFIDLRLTGTSTSTWADFLGVIGTTVSVAPGQTFRFALPTDTVVGGAMPAGGSISYGAVFQLSGTFVSQVAMQNGVVTVPAGVNQLRLFNSIANYSSGAVVDVTIRVPASASCKQITGIHAMQSTPGFKPTLRKGIVNLLPWSNDLTNASSWFPSASFVSTAVLKPDTSSAIHRVMHIGVGITSGAQYTSAVRASANGYRYLYVNGAASGGKGQACFDLVAGTVAAIAEGSATIHAVGDGTYMCCVSSISSAAQNFLYLQVNDSALAGDAVFVGDGVSGINIFSAGLFAGALTAAQILAAGGIPLTTTAPASSVAGVNYLEFDGVDDRLSLGGPLFQMSDDHCVIAGFNTSTVGAVIVAPGAVASGDHRLCYIRTEGGTGKARVEWYDGTTHQVVTSVSPILNQSVVLSGRKRAAVGDARLNGVSLGVTALTTLPVVTKAAIGDLVNGATNFTKGNIHCVLAIKGTVSDADLLVLEKFVAQLSGVTL